MTPDPESPPRRLQQDLGFPSRITRVTPDATESNHERMRALATEAWGLDVEQIERLGGWEDRNYRLRTGDGRGYVLKISPPETPLATLKVEAAILEHLSAQECLLPTTPQVIPNLAGGQRQQLEDRRGRVRWARLLTYLEGRPLVTADRRPPSLLAEIGRAVAAIDLALDDFEHPSIRETHEWDTLAVAELRPLARHIADPARRALVESELDDFETRVLPRCRELPRGVIHGDANDHNLLVSDDADRPRLAGVIDFGDCLRSVVISELGISLAYLMHDRDDPFADARHLIAGYHGLRPLNRLERELLPDLVRARICSSVLFAARGLALDPTNDYLQISAAPMWRLLAFLTSNDRCRFDRTVEEACR